MVASILIWYAIGSLCGDKVAKKIGDHHGTYVALSLTISGALCFLLVAFVYPTSLYFIWFSLSLYSLGFGMNFPLTVSRALALFENLRTTASSLRFLFITLFSFIGAYVAKFLDDDHLKPLSCYLLIASLLPLIVYTWGNFRVQNSIKK